MNTKQAQAPSLLTLARALEVQDIMVRRGMLTERAHDIANRVVDAEGYLVLDVHADGYMHIECTCGRTMYLSPDEDESVYASHVASALGVSLGLAA